MRQRQPFNAVYDTEEELFLGACDSRGAGGIGVIVNMSLSMNIGSLEQLTTRIGRLRLKRSASMPDLTIIAAYVPTSNYDGKEVEAFHMDLESLHREDHTFIRVIGDFDAENALLLVDEVATAVPRECGHCCKLTARLLPLHSQGAAERERLVQTLTDHFSAIQMPIDLVARGDTYFKKKKLFHVLNNVKSVPVMVEWKLLIVLEKPFKEGVHAIIAIADELVGIFNPEESYNYRKKMSDPRL
ncbi:unnamed protein product [Angiostrongylus costaricensis]|uniref:THUMP domain-containing protein n=1 Tax=Angiostrongylus costaricensis TaxID=334426 RepID=A0A0R3PA59_ANGCS|nr:unnamed protein product [Angiostrongylus costaricensis]